MAEYWKSTPKYWCKFCQVYVRDTKFERQQHDATGRHQSAIQRSLRDIHRTREREDRDKQRAKDEVARLNGLTSGGSGSNPSSSSSTAAAAAAAATSSKAKAEPPRQATAEERKRQLKQLAELGVAVPDEFRGEMAMAGEWQTVAVKPVDGSEEYRNANLGAGGAPLNVGVRSKRKAEDSDEEEEEAMRALVAGEKKMPAKKPGWGNSFKTFPGAKGGDPADDIEALLSGGAAKKVKVEASPAEDVAVKKEEDESELGVKKEPEDDGIKKEQDGDGEGLNADPAASAEPKLADIPPVKTEEGEAEGAKEDAGAATGGVVFKKRKTKALRQK